MSPFTVVNLDWQTIAGHTECYGDFQVRLSLTALSPLVLLALAFLIALGLSAWRTRCGGLPRRAHTSAEQTESLRHNLLLEAPEVGEAGPSEPPERLEPAYPSTGSEGQGEVQLSARRTKAGGETLSQIVLGAVLLALPFILGCAFILVPSVARAIFSAFDCEAFEFDDRDASYWCVRPVRWWGRD
jgi:hypothetical protein